MFCCCGEDGDASSGSVALVMAATFKGINGVVETVGDVVSVAVGMMKEVIKLRTRPSS